VKDCRALEVLLSLRAAGALDPAETARVEAHLASCPACRAEAAAAAEALSLARLPPPSAAERGAVRDLPARTLAALRRADRRRGIARRALAALAGAGVAAALAVAVIAPAVLRKAPVVPAPAAVEEAAWEEPDLDALWDDARVVDLETSARTGGDGAEAALAALDL
jgi:anti-sigma factor RsiW